MWSLNEFAGHSIRMRDNDGYMCATDMIKINPKKLMADYLRNKQTIEFVEEIKKEVYGNSHIPLIEVITKGANDNRGTWVHPKIAIHLAMWVSPTFSVKVIDWVYRFMQGDISLVKEIVDRHDAINDTKSEVLITSRMVSMDKQLYESKEQIQSLKLVNDELTKNLEKLNEFRCKYCDRKYSSTLGLTRHLNNNCPDRKACYLRLNLNLDKFKAYIKVLCGYQIEEFNYILKRQNWNGDSPTLIVMNKSAAKRIKLEIKYKEKRWRVVRFLQKHFKIPLMTLMDDIHAKFVMENDEKIIEISKHIRNKDDEAILECELNEELNPQ